MQTARFFMRTPPTRIAALAFASLIFGLLSATLCAQVPPRLLPGQPARTPAHPSVATSQTQISVSINFLANRHAISPYIYGVNFPPDPSYVTASGASLIRWGGNNSTRYNWALNARNIDADYYFENYGWGTPDSADFLSSMSAAGGAPLMTVPTLGWVAKDTTSNSFSVAKYGPQCSADPYRPDAGDGLHTDCSTPITGNDPRDADVNLLDEPGPGDPAGSVYRNQWLAAIAPNFGSKPHFYDLDNEPDIWGGTHRDVHPTPTGYDELANAIVTEGRAVRKYDPFAVRFAPVFCCWWFYWNGSNGNDKGNHGGLDFLPWLLNEIHFQDQAAGTQSMDIFDVHAYFNGPSANGLTQAQKQAAALRETRDWWDASYVSESGTVNQPWATQLQPSKTVAFVIPRLRALANSIRPGMPVSFTEWNGAIAGESDFSTALVDADAYGILGRERMFAASRWTAPGSSNPAYQSLLLYRNPDGKYHGFLPLSVQATHNADPNLFSIYASTSFDGKSVTLMVVNKDPANAAAVDFSLAGFQPAQYKTFTLSSAKPTTILVGASQAWTANQTFAPYSATLLVLTGAPGPRPAVEWDLEPDTTFAAASSTLTIAPRLTTDTRLRSTLALDYASSGRLAQALSLPETASPELVGPNNPIVTLTSATPTGGLSIALTQPTLSRSQVGVLTIQTPSTPGLYPYTVTGSDNAGVTQTRQGWILVGNPAASLTKTGDQQSAPHGSTLTLTATFVPGSSGATPGNVSLLFQTSAGTLSSQVVRTDGSGNATVTLRLPSTPGPVSVTAQAPIPWGGAKVTFTETAQ